MKTELPLLSEHPLRRPFETQKRAPLWLSGSSLCDPLNLHKGPSTCYPGKGLMAGTGESHAVTFTMLKEAYCWSLPKVLDLKASLKTLQTTLGPSQDCEVLTGYSYVNLQLRKEQFQQAKPAPEPSVCVSSSRSPPRSKPCRMQRFVKRCKR